jgi:hypothetical protein
MTVLRTSVESLAWKASRTRTCRPCVHRGRLTAARAIPGMTTNRE